MEILQKYLSQGRELNPEMLTFTANIDQVAKACPQIARGIVQELKDQRSYIKLIASENYCSPAVQSAMGNLLTDKYAEGYVGNRFYAGCDNVDDIEAQAQAEACKLFGAKNAYVQPHSGADANLVAFWAILRKKIQEPIMERLGQTNLLAISDEEWEEIRQALGNQRMLGMDLFSGGHLTHGYRHNVSGQMFEAHYYHVDKETGLLDYDNLRQRLHEVKPLIFLVGFSAYTRNIDYSILREYADEVGAVLMVDMAHFAGLVAGGVCTGKNNPVPYADVVTSTTHKTLRGPRGGLVLCTDEYAEQVMKGCPHVIGGPLPHVMAAKAIAFKEAGTPEFSAYAHRIIENSRHLAACFVEKGFDVQTGGTDNHIVLVRVDGLGITGKQAEFALRECGITLNRNALPYDINGPWYTSGLRFGTAAVTTLGMGTAQMEEIADIMAAVLNNIRPTLTKKGAVSKANYVIDEALKQDCRARVQKLLDSYVLYPAIDTDFFEGILL